MYRYDTLVNQNYKTTNIDLLMYKRRYTLKNISKYIFYSVHPNEQNSGVVVFFCTPLSLLLNNLQSRGHI